MRTRVTVVCSSVCLSICPGLCWTSKVLDLQISLKRVIHVASFSYLHNHVGHLQFMEVATWQVCLTTYTYELRVGKWSSHVKCTHILYARLFPHRAFNLHFSDYYNIYRYTCRHNWVWYCMHNNYDAHTIHLAHRCTLHSGGYFIKGYSILAISAWKV